MNPDSPESPRRRWMHLLVDGLVIVGSILFAFAIDAWWDTSRDAAATQSHLALLAEQNTANREGLAQAVERLSLAETAMDALVQLIGPRPDPVTGDSLVTLLVTSFGYGDFDVELSAVGEILTSGQLNTGVWGQLYKHLLAFRAASGYYEDSFHRLVDGRDDAVAYLTARTEFGSLLSPTVGDTTLFPVPVRKVLTDSRLEGLLVNLEVRGLTARRRAQYLMTVSDSIYAILAQAGAF